MTNIRLPQDPEYRWFDSWEEYGDAYGVDVIPDVWVMRCRRCRSEWPMRHNRGKLKRGAHVCPNGCNGKPKKARSEGTYPPMLRRHLEELQDWRGEREADEAWEDAPVRYDYDEYAEDRKAERDERKRRTKVWFTVRSVSPARWQALDRLWEEASEQTDPLSWVMAETGRLRRSDRGGSAT